MVLGIGVASCLDASATAQSVQKIAPAAAASPRSAVHPADDAATLRALLARVPQTRTFPPDFYDTLRGERSLFIIEMTTAPGCLPCAHLWNQLGALSARYGWQRRTIPVEEALLRSGRLGLPWVGNPVAWVRPIADPNRIIPVAIGADHPSNLARNLYLAAKMLTGVRPAVAVRGMARFTGIVGVAGAGKQAR